MNVAIISGASSGMGKEFVIASDKRYKFDEIWVIARRKDRLLSLQEHVNAKIVPFAVDLTADDGIKTIADALNEQKPDVKLLINCSGFGKFGAFDESSEISNANMCDLNLKSLITMTSTVLPFMHEGGKIINLGSLSSFMPTPHLAVYGATKAAVLSFSRALNFELRNKNIRVLCVCPYWVNTEFFDRATEKERVKKFDVLYEADYVVKTALNTLDKTKKDYVVPGKYAKVLRFFAKILGHRLVIRISAKKIKYVKND